MISDRLPTMMLGNVDAISKWAPTDTFNFWAVVSTVDGRYYIITTCTPQVKIEKMKDEEERVILSVRAVDWMRDEASTGKWKGTKG